MPPDAPAVFAGLEAGCECLYERDDASEDIGVLGDSHPRLTAIGGSGAR